ncbi:hypothetical protein KY290_030001 [Solanum tuberosum]|uniref:Putative plant transposon protein domain-containing protein n=1 Tax=Solanum tuberosum TaxID=4113 RepID=A0ABQ7UML5_SOLTU|nr:hypothetical protein KY290_030001 [Solanum tuberosum]
MIDWVTTFLRQGVSMILHRGSLSTRTMGPRRKNANQPAPVTASQSEGHDDSEASGSEVQINVTPEDHSPRATRLLARRSILQDSHPQSEERGSSSDNGENSRSQTDVVAGNQSTDDSRDSAESQSGSQADTSTSPPVATTEAEIRVREEAVNRKEEEEITDDDTMVMYMNAQEPNPTLRPQLIACYRSMWTVNRSKEFFNNGIVNKTGFDWMDSAPGEYSSHLTREFYSSYAATLMNFAADTETKKHGQKDMAICLFEGKHHKVTSDATMEDQTSRERVLRWIAKQIAMDGENAVWVTTTPTLITKASLSFPAKVWWAVARAQLRPTANDNTFSPSLASLVACLMDVANHLFGAKSAAVGTLVVVPHVPLDTSQVDRDPEQGESSQPSTEAPPPPASASQTPGTFVTISMLFLEKLVADQRQTRTLVDQIVLRMPQLIETKVLAAKKEIKYEMRTKLSVLKDRMDGLENLVQDRFHATGSADTEEFRAQLAKMRTQITKLDEKPAQVSTPVIPKSLMQMLSQAPSTQTLDDLWGAPSTSTSGTRKHIAGELDEETPTDPAREARSGAPTSTNEDHIDHVPRPESAPIDKGANADPTTGV